ncbi:MAG: RNA methyltransferase [Porticoccaceae bacterium]|nr:MAG: RNA methyltransferase [Porticoccaceae bacterium]
MGEAYRARRRFFDSLLTIYGRKPVLEALRHPEVEIWRLHLAEDLKPTAILDEILALARRRGVEIARHSRRRLAHISGDGRQDQGVAADLRLPGYGTSEAFLERAADRPFRLLALDGVTNPQNLGMIIRSVAASPLDGLLLPRRGCAPLCPLAVKASAGALFRARILRCERLAPALADFAAAGAEICVLASDAEQSIADHRPGPRTLYVLGSETAGVSPEVSRLAAGRLRIPMANGVESLNVAVTAALVAFRDLLAPA